MFEVAAADDDLLPRMSMLLSPSSSPFSSDSAFDKSVS